MIRKVVGACSEKFGKWTALLECGHYIVNDQDVTSTFQKTFHCFECDRQIYGEESIDDERDRP